jgi:CheY-like chemotaxis protein
VTKLVRVLLVEDERDIAELVRLILERRGHEVQVALSGEEALRMLEQEHLPDLILLDIIMPGLSGRDVLAQIKDSENLRDIPVYIFSVVADTDRDVIRSCLAQGASGYISKPFDVEEIERVISLVERRLRSGGHGKGEAEG